MNEHTTWSFPLEIEFETAPELAQRMRDLSFSNTPLVFDLSNTRRVHSSFVGFLIHTKHYLESHGMSLVLKTSPHIDKILAMLDLEAYFHTAPPKTAGESRTIQ